MRGGVLMEEAKKQTTHEFLNGPPIQTLLDSGLSGEAQQRAQGRGEGINYAVQMLVDLLRRLTEGR
jgi:hypothetical protein